jgi:hypothetical protein
MEKISRRAFLKSAALLGAATTASPLIFIPKAHAAWARKTPVHPNVDNLRVVGVADPKMIRGLETLCDWSRQDELVTPKAVSENMDRLACGLVDNNKPEEAWRTIFLKPPGKAWSDVVVAIKTNNIALQHTRSAVMASVCHTLTNVIGVKGDNIHIFDGCHGSSMERYTPFKGLPEGTKIEGKWGGINTPTHVPEPWSDPGGTTCVKHLVNGSVDILVNIALCKGHSSTYGGFTMTMKNHFGTFSPSPGHRSGGEDYLLAINQTSEILGTMDRRTGRVLFPRQQLCIVDALWAGKHGPGGHPSHQTNSLFMGVMSPVMDYLLTTRFRGEKMGWGYEKEATRRMLTEFGFSENDLSNGGKIIEI